MSSNSRAKIAAPRWRLPITSTLLVGFGGLVAIAVSAVMLISIRVAQENTDELLQKTASQRLDAAIARIDRYLEPVADDVGFLAGQLARSGDLSTGGDGRIETLMRGSLGGIPQVVAMAFVRPDLTSVRARRERTRDEIGTVTGSIASQRYGPELLEAAKRVRGVGWNSVFYVRDIGVSFISAMAPVFRDGEFRGALVAAVAVDELSLLIDSGDPETTMFILSATDEVIAHPQLARGGFTPTPDHFLLRRVELNDPVMRQLWSAEVDGGMAARIRTSNTGIAIVGNVGAPGRINYTLIGDTVNAAQRLEQLGKEVVHESDCIVLASEATIARLPADIPRQALGELKLRGMGDFEVYRLA